MLVRLFRTNQPGILVMLLILVPGLFLRHWAVCPPDLSGGMPLARAVAWLAGLAPWIHGTLVALWVSALAILVNLVANTVELTDRRNHLTVLLVPLAMALTVPPGMAGAAFFGLPFVVWAMHRVWSMGSGGKVLAALFDAGLLLGIAAMFDVSYAFMVVVVWSSVSVIRPFQWREYLVPLLGSALVFYLGWGVLRLLHIPGWAPLRTVMATTMGMGHPPVGFRWSLLLVLIPLTLVAIVRFSQQYSRGVVREQNIRSAFIAFSLTLGLIALLIRLVTGVFPGVLLAVPLAMLTPFALAGTRKAWIGELAVGCLLLLALWLQYTAA